MNQNKICPSNYHQREDSACLFCIQLKRGNYYKIGGNDVDSYWKANLNKDVENLTPYAAKLDNEIAKAVPQHPYYIATDYENYVIFTRCMNEKLQEGNRGIWVHARNPNPTAEDILRIVNRLIAIGSQWSSVPLFLSKCVTVGDFDQFVEDHH
uniref:uncharacterized protein LOC120333277 n=1 Tax=Styela clava TaxID=7725 RepID=UPI001939B701|nr:uncharacterized protein LOC120333277 [Styela clava]